MGTVGTDNHATIIAGNVYDQDPAAGTRVSYNTPVNLNVSLGPAEETIQRNVATGTDDGWWDDPYGSNYTNTAPVIYVLWINSNSQYHGWARFTNMTLPQGSTLSSATIRLYFNETLGGTKTGRIYCEDADNPTSPVSWSDAAGRVRTSAYKQFSTSHNVGSYIDIDVKSPVQEVINRGGWSSGNAIQLLIETVPYDDDSYLRFSSYNSTSYPEPRLTVVYET